MVVVRRFLTPRIRSAVFVVTAMFILSAATVGGADYVVIKVRHRPADELVGAVKAILSPDGTVIPDESNNTLIIVDEPGALKKAGELVAALDIPARHVRLRVTFFEAKDRRAVDLSVRWRYNDGGFAIGNHRDGDGGEGLWVAAAPRAMETSGTSVTNQDLLIVSGESGRIVTGTNVPVTDDVIVWFRRGGIIREEVVFREVSTGFVFTPTILDTKVHLDIIPFLSYFIDEKEGSIVFYEAATTVSVADGMTVVITENETEKGRLIGDIFSGFSKSGQTGSFYISVTPKIED
ncbi:MAG: hypothetical protein JW765_13645 [Deltaproteobacteria bacterium]|nr:hypothetical protein [Candidatus Zymogenaceae bacterium]